MADSKLDYNALGQALDTTWGRSSTPQTASYSVKLTLLGTDRVKVSYAAVVTFVSERQMIETKRAYATEADSVVSEVMKRVKALYKEISGSTLTVKEGETQDSVEVINLHIHNVRRTAYYRKIAVFEVA